MFQRQQQQLNETSLRRQIQLATQASTHFSTTASTPQPITVDDLLKLNTNNISTIPRQARNLFCTIAASVLQRYTVASLHQRTDEMILQLSNFLALPALCLTRRRRA